MANFCSLWIRRAQRNTPISAPTATESIAVSQELPTAIPPTRILEQTASPRSVTEQAHETGGCSGGVLRNEIQGLDACQSHRAVDEEADKAQGDVDQGLLQSRSGGDDTRADHPIKQDAEQAEEHTDHVHRSAAAFEYLGRGPAAGKCADGADDVVHGESDLALGCGHYGLFLKIGRSPVTDAVTDHINGHVGDGHDPQELVLEHIVHEQGLERKFLVS